MTAPEISEEEQRAIVRVLVAEARMANARANELDARLVKLRAAVLEYVEAHLMWFSEPHSDVENEREKRLDAAWVALRAAVGK